MTKQNQIGWQLKQSYQKLPNDFYTHIDPTAVKDPKLVVINKQLARELGFCVKLLQSEKGVKILGGNNIPEDSYPLAQAYAGHQFGHFTRLGDGRAILLGEQITPTKEIFDIQLKGAGRTPYSRHGDGRATLGPMLREYMVSEAMHSLGIPTTRGLAVVKAGESIFRETILEAAILTRVASSHLRVGTFQYAQAWGTFDDLKKLADYAILKHDQEVMETTQSYVHFLENVIDRQASLIAQWQLVGFVHGVMNTDNMTISGETIDYGPCAFMDIYHQQTVFSSIDDEGRYAYGNQPSIGLYNLTRFAETLLPLLHEDEKQAITIAQELLSQYELLFQQYYQTGMRKKLGLFNEEREDESLIKDLLHLLEKYQADYTNTFVDLTFAQIKETSLNDKKDFKDWLSRWHERRQRNNRSIEDSKQLMKQNNPAVIPRNHQVEKALDAAVKKDDFTIMNELIHVLSTPYEHTPDKKRYAKTLDNEVPYRTYCGT